MKKLILLTLASIMLTGCYATTNQTKKDLTVIGGCVTGGVLGNQIGSGSGKKIATISGIIAGCKAGEVVADKIVDEDKEQK